MNRAKLGFLAAASAALAFGVAALVPKTTINTRETLAEGMQALEAAAADPQGQLVCIDYNDRYYGTTFYLASTRSDNSDAHFALIRHGSGFGRYALGSFENTGGRYWGDHRHAVALEGEARGHAINAGRALSGFAVGNRLQYRVEYQCDGEADGAPTSVAYRALTA
ncbi:MAG: hypothetical protein GC136_09985 [Alphaproteobacteria bacterium]|nr:hypothetical protein [Alphaproteobacteria bacterium]